MTAERPARWGIFLLYGGIVPFFFWQGMQDVGLLKKIMYAGGVIMLFLWLITGIARRRQYLSIGVHVIPPAAAYLVGLPMVAFLLPGPTARVAEEAGFGLVYLIVVVMATHLWRGETDPGSLALRRITSVVAGAGAGVALLGILQFYWNDWFSWTRVSLASPWGTRIFSTIGNPNWCADVLIQTFPLIGMSAAMARRPAARAAWGAAAVAGYAALILTGSMGGLAGWVVSVVLLGWWIGARRPMLRRGAAILGAALLAVTVVYTWPSRRPPGGAQGQASTLVRLAQTTAGDTYSVGQRVLIVRDTLRMALAHPMLGAGVGRYVSLFPLYMGGDLWEVIPLGRLVDYAHNEYLQLAAEGGLAGVAVLAWLLAAYGRTAWRLRDHPDAGPWAAAWAAGAAATLVHSGFNFNFHVLTSASFFWLNVGVIGGAGSAAQFRAVREKSGGAPSTAMKVGGWWVAGATGALAMCFLWGAVRILRADLHAKAGLQAWERGLAGVAEDHLEEARRLNPWHTQYALELGRIFEDTAARLGGRESYERAAANYADAVRNQPYNPVYLANVGRVAAMLAERWDDPGALARAEAALRLAARVNPTMGSVRETLLGLRRTPSAARRGEPGAGGRDAWRPLLARAVSRISRREWPEAATGLERVVQMRPADPVVRFYLGNVYAMLGRFAEARREMEATLRLDPSHTGARHNLEQLKGR